MDRLTEIRTKIECYQNFLEDLEEITSALEANAKIGEIAFLLEESIEQLQSEEDEILADMEQSANRQEEV